MTAMWMVQVDETRIQSLDHELLDWWMTYRSRAETARRPLRVVDSTLVGETVQVGFPDSVGGRRAAEEFRSLLVAKGVPYRALRMFPVEGWLQ